MTFLNVIDELMPHAKGIVGVLTDIDDTLTQHGRLNANTLAAMQALQDAGIKLMPITGGAASLALHAARLWPVSGAIGESGAVLYQHDGQRLHTHYWDEPAQREAHAAQRFDTFSRIQAHVPRARLAADQCFRLCDLAINLNEDLADHEKLSAEELQRVRELLHSEGYTLRQSSIHLNAWKSSYDKLPMAKRALRALWGIDIDAPQERMKWVYVGDAPNDEAMFEFFPLSVGVANVTPHLPAMRHQPRYITRQTHGAGFAELATLLLKHRA